MFSFFRKKRKPVKLLDMTLDHCTDVMATLTVELLPILADQRVMSISTSMSPKKGETQLDYGLRVGQTLLETISLFSGEYKSGIYRILAAFFQESLEEVGKLSMREVAAQVKASLRDEDLINFLSQQKPSGRSELSVISRNPEG
ncbi:MAG: hypothetical protein FWE19_00570 [Oscillospiraceae bacterium]|nr:hypothetical protein [Oscillospiraceae bacterium]